MPKQKPDVDIEVTTADETEEAQIAEDIAEGAQEQVDEATEPNNDPEAE